MEKNKSKHLDDTGAVKLSSGEENEENKKETEHTTTVSSQDNIVFAPAGKPIRVYSSEDTTMRRRSKIIAISSAAGVCVVAVVIAIVLLVGGSTDDELAVETEASSAESSEQDDSAIETLATVAEPEITEVDTATITFGEGVTVEGVDLSGLSLAQAYNELEPYLSDIRDEISITIKCDGKTLTLTEDDFSFDYDISDVIRQAYHYSRGELDTPTVSYTVEDGVADFSISCAIDEDSIDDAMETVKEAFNVEPVDAHVSSFDPNAVEKFTYEDGTNGYIIDEDDVKSQITEILSTDSKTDTLNITTTEEEFTVTLEEIKTKTKLISSYSTTAKSATNSIYNMKLALASANGVILEPGEIFSFNDTTGDTTNGLLGYVESTSIVNGKYVQEYGGGICQASSTIYVAAVLADMEIIERYAHAYKSSYADRGLDATVDYGNLDMRFKNSSDYPIYIATYSYDYDGDGYDELMVEIYGEVSDEYDEIVAVGWVTSAGSSRYTARGAKVYFKDGVEIGRENLPSGSYMYSSSESQSYIETLIPDDVSYGPTSVTPTNSRPTVYSPGGCGSSAEYDDDFGTTTETTTETSSSSSSSSSTSSSSSSKVTSSSGSSTSSKASSSSGSSSSSTSSKASSSSGSSGSSTSSKASSSSGSSSKQESSQAESSSEESSEAVSETAEPESGTEETASD